MLERYPKLDHLAYIIVGWVGVKLAFMAAHNYTGATKQLILGHHVHELNPSVFWSVLGLICLIGGIVAFRDPNRPTTPDQQDSTD
jgi:predicted tellurium resistance membrane protein TerC